MTFSSLREKVARSAGSMGPIRNAAAPRRPHPNPSPAKSGRGVHSETYLSKTVLITGASRGIGRAAALLAGSRGWAVGVNYASDERAAMDVVDTIARAGGRAVALRGDVSVEGDVIAMFDGAERALGLVTGVVVNAGIVAPTAKLIDMSVERMRRVFDVNVLGAYLTAREAARRMSKSRGGAGGAIVLISSAAARLGSPNLYVDYAGSKGAIDTLTAGLAKELAPEGIRVNAIRPGLIETDIHASGGEPDRAFTLGATAPMGRPGKPEEIAAAIGFLLDEETSSYVTGAILDVSGGR
jgi:NAD(P)-dependent dehydrogenase (short-subunit alcohol dehydrogenase family)